MLRRYRLGVPALLATGVYLVALAVTVVVALATGDFGALWWLTLFMAPAEEAQPAWPNVLLLALAGLVVAWALWQCLRGPLTGPLTEPLTGPPGEQDRDTRWLRVALYVAAASTLAGLFLVNWSGWGAVVMLLPMVWVVVMLSPGLARTRVRGLILTGCGVLGYGGTAVVLVFELVWSTAVAHVLVTGFATLIWNVLALRGQWDDGRWQRSTVKYGILALVLPLVLTWAGALIGLLIGVPWAIYRDVVAVVGVLAIVWLARSAHDLAAPRTAPVLSE